MWAKGLVRVVRAEQRPRGVAQRLLRLGAAGGDHHRDGVGAGIGPEDVDERRRLEHGAFPVEEDQVGVAKHRQLQRPRPVARRVHLVALLSQRAGQRPDGGQVGVGDEHLARGGHRGLTQ
jgi:hypothetical protein